MEIIINGQQAFLKKNTSFEYISENSLFTGSDSYTLTITFPLKDCPQNIRIFGHIHRQDVEKSRVTFDCEIRDKAFYKSGVITVTQVNEVEVKTQFLEGRSEQNFNDSFDEIFINELKLGYPASRTPETNPTQEMWLKAYPTVNSIPLPWVNNTSGNMQNEVKRNASGNLVWASSMALTFQPYLKFLLEKICTVVGYTGDFSALTGTKYQYLLVCNTLPALWFAADYGLALPHWSLTELLEQLEVFLGGEFFINHKEKTVQFEFSHRLAARVADVRIDKVISKYTVDVAKDDRTDYIGSVNFAYEENDNRLWAYRSCRWYIDAHKSEAVVYDTLAQLLAWARTQKESGVETYTTQSGGHSEFYSRGYPRGSEAHKLFYARDVDTYFIMYCYKAVLVKTTHISSTGEDMHWYKYYNRLEPVNQFGKFIQDDEAEDREMGIVPAWIDDTDEDLGPCLFLECGDMGSVVTWTQETDSSGNTTGEVSGNGGGSFGGRRAPAAAAGAEAEEGQSGGNFSGQRPSYGNTEYDETDYDSGALAQTRTGKAIEKGEQERGDAYFDKLYVGFWDGVNRQGNLLPHPIVDRIEVRADFTVRYAPYTLRIEENRRGQDEQGVSLKYTKVIDGRKKYNFSFLSEQIPDPRAVFYIDGGRYVCEKMTATFHEESGKSQLIKGVFYRIIE